MMIELTCLLSNPFKKEIKRYQRVFFYAGIGNFKIPCCGIRSSDLATGGSISLRFTGNFPGFECMITILGLGISLEIYNIKSQVGILGLDENTPD